MSEFENLQNLSWVSSANKAVHDPSSKEFVLQLEKDRATLLVHNPKGLERYEITNSDNKWKSTTLPKSYSSLVHLVRDLLEAESKKLMTKEPKACQSYEELVGGFLSPHVDASYSTILGKHLIFGQTTKRGHILEQTWNAEALTMAFRANTYSKRIVLEGKPWAEIASRILRDNFSATEFHDQYSSSDQTKKVRQLEERNKTFQIFQNLFELCEENSDLMLAAYHSLVELEGQENVNKYLLHFASGRGHVPIVKLLVEKFNGDFNEIHPATQETPLMLAVRNQRNLVLKIFDPKGEYGIGWYENQDRNQVEAVLKGKPPGSFVTRYSDRAGSYVISHVLANGNFDHISNIIPHDGGQVKIPKGAYFDYFTTFKHYIYSLFDNPSMNVKFPLPGIGLFVPKNPSLVVQPVFEGDKSKFFSASYPPEWVNDVLKKTSQLDTAALFLHRKARIGSRVEDLINSLNKMDLWTEKEIERAITSIPNPSVEYCVEYLNTEKVLIRKLIRQGFVRSLAKAALQETKNDYDKALEVAAKKLAIKQQFEAVGFGFAWVFEIEKGHEKIIADIAKTKQELLDFAFSESLANHAIRRYRDDTKQALQYANNFNNELEKLVSEGFDSNLASFYLQSGWAEYEQAKKNLISHAKLVSEGFPEADVRRILGNHLDSSVLKDTEPEMIATLQKQGYHRDSIVAALMKKKHNLDKAQKYLERKKKQAEEMATSD